MGIKQFFQGYDLRVVLLTLLFSLVFIGLSVSASSTIGNNISTGGTLTVTGAVTTSGNVTLGDAAGDVILSTGGFQASSTALFGGTVTAYGLVKVPAAYGIDTSAAGALNLGTTTATSVIIGSSSAKVGIASSSPYVALGVTGTTTSSAGAVIGSGGSPMTQVLFGTCSVNLPSITGSTTAVTTCTATGVSTNDKVFVTPASLEDHIIFTSASSTGNDTIQIAAYNTGVGGDVNPAAATWAWMAIR